MPLRYLFVDMNAFFASVEQQDDPRLRGRPVAVAAVDAPTTSCIAASYEAKRRGVKTGTPVWQARQLCPGIVIVPGRHKRYVEVHHQLVKAVGRCLPVGKVMSIDEMACPLLGAERTRAGAEALGRQIKAEVAGVGAALKCSIGAGPNVLLAKVASDMQKPDGLTVIDDSDLPAKLYALALTDFPGIGPRMEKRLHRYGVTTVQHLFRLTATQLSTVWGSRVHGERWFWRLRGEDVPEAASKRRTLGHSHVLPPDLRTDAGAFGVLSKLMHKAAARLRSIAYWAGAVSVGARFGAGRWDAGCKVPRCQDTLNLLRTLSDLWGRRPPDSGQPRQVWLVLSDLVPARSATPSLFPFDRQVTELSHAMDAVNRRFGRNSVRFGTVCGSEETGLSRIAFTEVPEFNPAFGG